MRINIDLAVALRGLIHLANQPAEGDPSAAEMAEAQRLPLTIVHGKCRMLSQRGWVAANRDGHRLRYSLAVPATEIDLGQVAVAIGGVVRPSLKDWRATSLDPDL